MPRPPPIQLRRIETRQLAMIAQPPPELCGYSRVLQHVRPVEVVQVVHRIRNIVGDIHDRTLERLLILPDRRKRREHVRHLLDLSGIGGELHRSLADIVADPAGHPRRRRRPIARPFPVLPRILEHRSSNRTREIETARRRLAAVEGGENPKRLRVPLESVIEAQHRPRHPVEFLLAEVAERRVPQIVGGRGRRHDNRITPAEAADRIPGRFVGVDQRDRDRPGHRGDLERVSQPVVDDGAGPGLRDDLGDRGQAGEERGEPDPFDIDAELVLSWAGLLGDIAIAAPGQVKSLAFHELRLPKPPSLTCSVRCSRGVSPRV